MKKMIKALSIILVAVMLFGMLALGASAAEKTNLVVPFSSFTSTDFHPSREVRMRASPVSTCFMRSLKSSP